MPKVQIKGFIQKTRNATEPTFCSADMSEYGYMTICEVDFEFEYEVPAGWSAEAAEIAAIDKKLTVMADDYHAKTTELKTRKAELQCIDNVPMMLREQAA